jgi:hypothetical protein
MKNVSDQNAIERNVMWAGYSVEVWEQVYFVAIVVTAIAGAIAIVGAVISGIVGYRIADTVQREANLGIAAANERAEQAHERVAQLDNETERLRAQNLSTQKALMPRRIIMGASSGDREKRQKLFDGVREFAGMTALIQVVPDFESSILAGDIANVLTQYAGWNVERVTEERTHIPFAFFSEGVLITNEEGELPRQEPPTKSEISKAGRAGQALVDLLTLDLGTDVPFFGVRWLPHFPGMPLLGRDGVNLPADTVLVLVGMKPLRITLEMHELRFGKPKPAVKK